MATEDQLASLTVCAEEIDGYQEEVFSLTGTAEKFNKKVDDLENCSRRNNSIVYCVQKSGRDVPESFEEVVVRDIFRKR